MVLTHRHRRRGPSGGPCDSMNAISSSVMPYFSYRSSSVHVLVHVCIGTQGKWTAVACLSDLAQRDKEAKEPRSVVRLKTLCSLAVESNVKEQEGLRCRLIGDGSDERLLSI